MDSKYNRRDFLKLGLAATAVASASVVTGTTSPLFEKTANAAIPLTEHNDLPYQVDPRYQRIKCSKLGWMRLFDPTEPPVEFLRKDTSVLSGKPDTGKDLPRIIGETINIRDRNVTLYELGVLYFFYKDLGVMQTERANDPGYRQVDVALATGAWSVERDYAGFTAVGQSPGGITALHPVDLATDEMAQEPVYVRALFNWDNSTAKARQSKGKVYKFESKDEASKYVKKATRYYGADLVGIAPYDERWVYGDWARLKTKPYKRADGRTQLYPFNVEKFTATKECETFGFEYFDADFEKYAGFKPKSVIAFAVEMDYAALRCSPGGPENGTVGMGYSRMAEIGYKVATFLREIGYSAAPSGNGDGQSIMHAVQAGLGEVGRNAMLITEKYGPRVRLGKIYTDLEMTPDKPVTFGVREFCTLCKKCADACPGQAISHEKDARMQMPEDCGPSENPYTEKWVTHFERCICGKTYTSGCSNCLAVCSWNKLDQWNHDVARIATRVPLIKHAARKFDEWFGYNGPADPNERYESGFIKNAVLDFWDQ